jgi:hypothetical protein
MHLAAIIIAIFMLFITARKMLGFFKAILWLYPPIIRRLCQFQASAVEDS